MLYGLKITTEPASEPVTAAEVKLQCGIASGVTGWDSLITIYIAAARKWCEEWCNRSFINTTWELKLDHFPYSATSFYLPRSTVQSVSSISYVDTAGNTQTWTNTNYVLSASREPARVSQAYNIMWPTVRYQPDAVTVAYIAGYGASASNVPAAIKHAILMLCCHMFNNRSAVDAANMKEIPMGVKALLQPYVVGDEFTVYGGKDD